MTPQSNEHVPDQSAEPTAAGVQRDAEVRYPSDPDTPLQTAPVEDGAEEASTQEKIDGIVAQTRHDLARGHGTSARELLDQRFQQSGITISRERLSELADSLGTDDGHPSEE